jgi:hypothetical protein
MSPADVASPISAAMRAGSDSGNTSSGPASPTIATVGFVITAPSARYGNDPRGCPPKNLELAYRGNQVVVNQVFEAVPNLASNIANKRCCARYA